MEITYKFGISAFNLALKQGTLEKVITGIHWDLVATAEDGVSERYYAETHLPAADEDNFTPFEEINTVEGKEIIFGWLEKLVDLTKIKENLVKQIEFKKNPQTITIKPNF